MGRLWMLQTISDWSATSCHCIFHVPASTDTANGGVRFSKGLETLLFVFKAQLLTRSFQLTRAIPGIFICFNTEKKATQNDAPTHHLQSVDSRLLRLVAGKCLYSSLHLQSDCWFPAALLEETAPSFWHAIKIPIHKIKHQQQQQN